MESFLLLKKRKNVEPPPEVTMTYQEFSQRVAALKLPQYVPNALHSAGRYRIWGQVLYNVEKRCYGSPWGFDRFAVTNDAGIEIMVRHAMPTVEMANEQNVQGKLMIVELNDYTYANLPSRTRNGATSLMVASTRSNNCLSVIYHDSIRMTARIIRPYGATDTTKAEDYVFP